MHEPAPDALARARRWIAIAIAVGSFGYVGYALWSDLPGTGRELTSFQWSWFAAAIGLTLINYGLRFAKWHWLLARLGIHPHPWPNLWIFMTGLAMAISPGRAGEVVKPYLLRLLTGASMTQSIPVLITERATDGMAVVTLAAIGVSTYQSESVPLVIGTIGTILLSLAIISSKTLVLGGLSQLAKVPRASSIAEKLTSSYVALRECVSPGALIVTYLVSLAAWWAECVGYWLIWKGLRVEASLDASTFLYAFATFFGAPSPGGLGMADGALGEGAQLLLHVDSAKAFTAAVLIRIATLWLGVIIGGITLLFIEPLIQKYRPVEA